VQLRRTHSVVSHKTGQEIKIGTVRHAMRESDKKRLKARERLLFQMELATPEGHEQENSSSRDAASSSFCKRRGGRGWRAAAVKP